MSSRLRGQEITVRMSVEGQLQEGSFFKIKDWEVTPRSEITEEGYLGETEDDLDFIHNGYDFSFNVDIEDDRVLNFLEELSTRNENRVRAPRVNITVQYAFRDGTVLAVAYYDCFVKVGTESAGSRTDNVTASLEGKCKKRAILSV